MPGYSSDENQRKHLDIIQGVITRLAGNSFSIKTWAVGLITVLGGLAAKDATRRVMIQFLLDNYRGEERVFQQFPTDF